MPSTEIQSATRCPDLLTSRENFQNDNAVEAKRSLVFEALHLHGYCRLQVSGSSMLPAIWPGETVLIERWPMERLVPGDVVLHKTADRVFLHRLQAVRSCHSGVELITRGDTMLRPDPPVPAERLVGVLVGIHRNGQWVAPSRGMSFRFWIVTEMARRSALFLRMVLRLRSQPNVNVLNEEFMEAR